MAQAQSRPRKRNLTKSIRPKESKVLNSEEETREDVAPDEDAVSPTGDPVIVDDKAESDSKNKLAHDEPAPKRRPQPDPSKIKVSKKNWEDVLVVSREIARYTHDLVHNALRLAQPLLSALLALWLFIAIVRHFIFPSIEKSLTFGCRLPFASGLRLCQIPSPLEIPKVDETMQAQSDYGEVLQFVRERQELPLDLLVSANKAADLQIDVAQSDLPSRDSLGHEFGRFDGNDSGPPTWQHRQAQHLLRHCGLAAV